MSIRIKGGSLRAFWDFYKREAAIDPEQNSDELRGKHKQVSLKVGTVQNRDQLLLWSVVQMLRQFQDGVQFQASGISWEEKIYFSLVDLLVGIL
jgi:hypothetical protein